MKVDLCSAQFLSVLRERNEAVSHFVCRDGDSMVNLPVQRRASRHYYGRAIAKEETAPPWSLPLVDFDERYDDHSVGGWGTRE